MIWGIALTVFSAKVTLVATPDSVGANSCAAVRVPSANLKNSISPTVSWPSGVPPRWSAMMVLLLLAPCDAM